VLPEAPAVNETNENDQLNDARVKFITSQDMITARYLYAHFFDFFPTHKTFLTTNHKPIVREPTRGFGGVFTSSHSR
jgi:putative DNA primase/helicase